MSPRSTTRPLYFLCFFSNSEFFSWQSSINGAKCTFTYLCLASSITSDLFLTFARFHAKIFLSFHHSLSSTSFAAGAFIAGGIGKICVIWSSWILAQFPPYAVFWFHLLLIFMSIWICDHIFEYGSTRSGTLPFATHGRSCLYFQFLPCILDDLHKLIPCPLDRWNKYLGAFGHSRAVVFHLPNFVSPSFENSLTYFYRFRATNDQVWNMLAVSLVSPWPHVPSRGSSFSKVICLKSFHESDKSLDPSMFQQ